MFQPISMKTLGSVSESVIYVLKTWASGFQLYPMRNAKASFCFSDCRFFCSASTPCMIRLRPFLLYKPIVLRAVKLAH